MNLKDELILCGFTDTEADEVIRLAITTKMTLNQAVQVVGERSVTVNEHDREVLQRSYFYACQRLRCALLNLHHALVTELVPLADRVRRAQR